MHGMGLGHSRHERPPVLKPFLFAVLISQFQDTRCVNISVWPVVDSQAQQHHDPLDDLTPKHYKGFLVDTPLIHVPPTQTAAAAAGGAQASGQQQQQHQAAGMPSCGYGSFHQQYWLDGKLVAVGVVDVLPR
jgi:hypothetical protein